LNYEVYWFFWNFFVPLLHLRADRVRGFPEDNYPRSGRAGMSSRTGPILKNLSYIDSLPFDGIMINIPATWGLLAPGNVADYNGIYTNCLAPLKGTPQGDA
jgi:hypothetical protein